MTTTIDNITDTQIRNLRSEAAKAGDLVQAHICDVALGDEEPVTTGEQWEERYGGGGFTADEQSTIMAIASKEQALAECVRTIAAAEAMADD